MVFPFSTWVHLPRALIDGLQCVHLLVCLFFDPLPSINISPCTGCGVKPEVDGLLQIYCLHGQVWETSGENKFWLPFMFRRCLVQASIIMCSVTISAPKYRGDGADELTTVCVFQFWASHVTLFVSHILKTTGVDPKCSTFEAGEMKDNKIIDKKIYAWMT